jgi:hypothetical protein
MIEHIDTYTLPTWTLPALINGDADDLSGTDENDLEVFLLEFEHYEGLVFEPKGEPFFSFKNDVSGLGDLCVEVDIYGHRATE